MPTALVTGANSFVAFHVIHALLDRGYDVVGQVRSESKSGLLKSKFGTYGAKLQFVVVPDIITPTAFDEVLKRRHFDFVVHTASPASNLGTDIENDVYKPAIEGTLGILRSIHLHAPSVHRVVLTSSWVAIVDILNKLGRAQEHCYSEVEWNPITHEDGLSNRQLAYFVSKTLAEQAAWDFVKKHQPKFTMTTLCAPMSFGPPENITNVKEITSSSAYLYAILTKKMEPPIAGPYYVWVDVRDLGIAHALALEAEKAAGERYLIAAGCFCPQHLWDFVWTHYSDDAEARGLPRGTPGEYRVLQAIDASKSIRDLGISYRSFDDMIATTYDSYRTLERESLKE